MRRHIEFNAANHYIQSIAWTKYVRRNGSITQNHSGRMIRNPIVSNKDTAKYSQYFPVDLVVDAIIDNSCSCT